MIDAAYRLAAHSVLSRLLRSHPVKAGEPARDAGARVRALRQLNVGLGLVTLPPAVRRSAPQEGEQLRGGVDRTGYVARTPALEVVQRQLLARSASAGPRSPAHALVPSRPGAASAGAGKPGAVLATDAGIRRFLSGPPVASHRLPPAFNRRGADAGAVSAKLPSGLHMAAFTAALAKTARRADPISAPHGSSRARHQSITSAPQAAVAPGFHRTVRQPQAKPAAGNVYLDKALVGYHLAAAVTAEQTRAAARPNGAAAGFNGSMAALRPAGAGL